MTHTNESDHNLLIRLDQKVSDISIAVRELKDGTFSKIAALEKDKADKNEVERLQRKVNDDIEKRVVLLETRVAKYFLTITIYSAIGATMIALIIYHILHTQ
jgi:hypothetical protein